MKRVMVLIVLSVFVTGCGGTRGDQTAPPPISEQSTTPQTGDATATFSPFATVPPELLPTGEATLYAIPPEVLTTAELHERLDPFASSICQLPCYGGLIPGEANVQDAIAFYSQLGIAVVDLAPGDFEDSRDGTGHMRATLLRTTDILQAPEMGLNPPQVDIYLEEDVTRYMYIGWQYQPDYLSMERVFSELGEPDRAQVGITRQGQVLLYVITFTYAEGINGAYSFAIIGAFEGTSEEPSICLTEENIGALYLATFAPGETPLDGLFEETLLPLSEGLGISTSELVTQASGGQCIPMSPEQFDQLLNS